MNAPLSRSGPCRPQPRRRGARLIQAIGAILAWLGRARPRRVPGGLSDHMLNDIGVDRPDPGHDAGNEFRRD